MSALFRLTMMLVGYIWACVAASFILTLATLAPDWNDLDAFSHSLGQSGDWLSVALWATVGIGAAVIFAIGFLPTLIAVVLTEAFNLRSIITYGLIGGALALAAAYSLESGGYVAASDVNAVHGREVFAAAGIAGGLVYWLFAGRRAGGWK